MSEVQVRILPLLGCESLHGNDKFGHFYMIALI